MAPAESTPRSPCFGSDMPPNSPRLYPSPDIGAVERIEQAVQKLVQALEKGTKNKFEDAKPEATKEAETGKPKIRASKLEHKQVEEVWDPRISKYKIVNSTAPPAEITDLDEYVFIIRTRTDRTTLEQMFYVDIKSEGPRDILGVVLRDVRGLFIREESVTVERALLYRFVTELKDYRGKLEAITFDYFRSVSLSVSVKPDTRRSQLARVAATSGKEKKKKKAPLPIPTTLPKQGPYIIPPSQIEPFHCDRY